MEKVSKLRLIIGLYQLMGCCCYLLDFKLHTGFTDHSSYCLADGAEGHQITKRP